MDLTVLTGIEKGEEEEDQDEQSSCQNQEKENKKKKKKKKKKRKKNRRKTPTTEEANGRAAGGSEGEEEDEGMISDVSSLADDIPLQHYQHQRLPFSPARPSSLSPFRPVSSHTPSSPHESPLSASKKHQPSPPRVPAPFDVPPIAIAISGPRSPYRTTLSSPPASPLPPHMQRQGSAFSSPGSGTCRSPSQKRHQRRLKQHSRIKKRALIAVFVVGVCVGAWALLRYQKLFVEQFAEYLPTPPVLNISAVFPAGIGDINVTTSILNDVYDILSNAISPAETYPGKEAAQKNYTAKHPIVLIPGFVTTGLEVWQGEECASSLFRSRLWGAFTMLQTMLMAPSCWTKHMALDMETGLDPPGIKIRPAQGLEAADFFMPGFWVWARIIKDFAAIGYDHSNLVLMSYDWRLSLHDLERRDHFFTLLKIRIETLVKINKRKIAMIAHSYGTNVMVYFFAWVESRNGGNGGPNWVENHVDSFVNIAGPLLGVIKAATSYVSGEMHDTTEFGPLEGIMFGKEKNAFHRTNRRKLWRTWGSLTAMLPKGGQALWGNLTHAPDDIDYEELLRLSMERKQQEDNEAEQEKITKGSSNTDTSEQGRECLPIIENGSFVDPSSSSDADRSSRSESCVTPAELANEPVRYGQAIGFSQQQTGNIATGDSNNKSESNSSSSSNSINSSNETSTAEPKKNWTIADVIDYLKNDPEDPHLRRRMTEDYDFGYVTDFKKQAHVKDDKKFWTNPLSVQLPRAPSMKIYCYYGVGKPTERAYTYKTDANGQIDAIDTSVNDPSRNISGGVLMAEGDGTVTLSSLGYHCAKLWRQKSHNPSGIKVTTRELWHTTVGLLPLRGGGGSADHVDIMGNTMMAEDLLKIVSGNEDDGVLGQDRYYSQILKIVEKIQLNRIESLEESDTGTAEDQRQTVTL